MREIKFRAWAKQYQKHEMYYFKLGSAYEDDYRTYLRCEGDEDLKQCRLKDEDCAVMQYTGLKDKNGKEIYEGDLLQMDEEAQYQANRVIEVAYYWGIPCGKLPNEDTIVQDLHELCVDRLGNYKPKHGVAGAIVGNIYENPELLTNK